MDWQAYGLGVPAIQVGLNVCTLVTIVGYGLRLLIKIIKGIY